MNPPKQEYTLYRFTKYLWKIRRGGTTVAWLSVGSNKRYYVLNNEPRVPLVETFPTGKKAFDAFRRAVER